MLDRRLSRPLDEVAQKWRDIAERRREHFIRLYDTGRWKLYYTEEEFLTRMREAIALVNRWTAITEPPEPQDDERHWRLLF
jgi:uncharacterized repeat protein (TIGR03809 family)